MQYVDNWGDAHLNGYAFKKWLADNRDIALFVAAGYLAFVFKGPALISKILGPPGSSSSNKAIPTIKKAWMVWNLLLSVFAFYGTTRVVPPLLRNLKVHGVHDTLCTFRPEEFYTTRVGTALALFCISKLPEFGDTFFLLLQGKKRLPFLQWFHHTSMFLFVWYAYEAGSSIFITAAAMNYFVHTIMYFYFAMAEAGYKDQVKPFAPYITILQLLQMIGVMYTSGYVIFQKYASAAAGVPDRCPGTDLFNARIQFVIYSFFLYLFGKMFVDSHIRKPKAVEEMQQQQRVAKTN